MNRWVEISFDCIPLRSIERLDIPLDASPKYRAFCERLQTALEKHGAVNSYFLHQARCKYHLLNCEDAGFIEFRFSGTVLTDGSDVKCQHCDLVVELVGETCDWLSEPILDWFAETVPKSVAVEFDRYIAAGDLEKTRARIDQMEADSDSAGGFVGMYL
ncbi:MAG: hypothetical protein AAGF97_10385 [Planctomycetota bacterium]